MLIIKTLLIIIDYNKPPENHIIIKWTNKQILELMILNHKIKKAIQIINVLNLLFE